MGVKTEDVLRMILAVVSIVLVGAGAAMISIAQALIAVGLMLYLIAVIGAMRAH